MMLEPNTIRIHGRDVAYVDGGEGPVLLLVHGIGGDWQTWETVLDDLARSHRVVAVDLPGHGGSAKGAGDYSLGGMANVLRDLMAALDIERATFVGHSLGGGVAMQFAYQYPERCERLVLVSSGGLGPDVGLLLRAATLPGSELFLQLTAPAARSVIDCAGKVGDLLRVKPSADATFYGRAFSALAEPETRAAFLGTLRGVVSTRGQLVDARDRLYLAETLPTLIVWGEHDAVIPVSHGREAHEAIPHSRLEVFEHSGHVPQLDEPARFVAAVEAFMAETEPSEASEERWTALLRANNG